MRPAALRLGSAPGFRHETGAGARWVAVSSLLVVLLGHSTRAAGAEPYVDTTFGKNGVVTTIAGGGETLLTSIALQADGKVVAAGFAAVGRADEDFVAIRYLNDGSLDRSFGSNGKAVVDFGRRYDFADHVLLQLDGRMLLIGSSAAQTYEDEFFSRHDFALARLDRNGKLDPTFGSGGVIRHSFDEEDLMGSSMLLPDGTILSEGTLSRENGAISRRVLVRLLRSGDVDPSFGVGGIVDLPPSAATGRLLRTSDGKILIAGSRERPDDRPFFAVSRFTSAGRPDATFGQGGTVLTSIEGLAQTAALDRDGRILIGGTRGGEVAPLARLRPTGQPDRTFGPGGARSISMQNITSVFVDRSGRIVVSGDTFAGREGRFATTRLRSDGTFDPGFAGGGIASVLVPSSGSNASSGAVVTSDGRPVVAGTVGKCGCNHWAYGGTFALVRFLASSEGKVTSGPKPLSANAPSPDPDSSGVVDPTDASSERETERAAPTGERNTSGVAGQAMIWTVVAAAALALLWRRWFRPNT